MADVPLVLNNVLCFMANKYVKTTVKSLKTILTYFFSADDLAAAKAQLIMDMDKLITSTNRPHLPHRRDGDARLVREVEDIVTAFTFLDE